MVASGTKENNISYSNSKNRSKFNGALNKSQKMFGVKFAPINVPWERRKQTLGVLTWVMLFLFTGPGGPAIMLFILFCTKYWILVILYAAWIFYDRDTCNKGSRKIDGLKHWIVWKLYRNYFPIKLVKTAELDPKRNYLFASHPHGILSSGSFCTFATEGNEISKAFPGMAFHLLTLPLNFWLPLYREFCLGLGICSAKKESMNYLLSHPDGGKVAILVPGGAPESLDSHPGSYVVQLKRRKGFIKVALQNGSPLVPVFCFGETDIYYQIDNPEGSLLRTIQDKAMQILSFAPLIFTGRGIFQYSFGFLPRRHPIFVVVGAPIEVEKVIDPSQDQIDTLHEKYTEELKRIFDTYKDDFADPGTELRLI